MSEQIIVKERDEVIVRFSGDSGDGMQLAGKIFSTISATVGNDICTFPDYPADIRAPQGSLTGVSGFQVHIGAGKVYTPGDLCDVLVAMNAAALKTQYRYAKPDATIIIDTDSFGAADLKKAAFATEDPLAEMGIDADRVIACPITQMVKDCLAGSGMEPKAVLKCRNMFALGLVCWLFDRDLNVAFNYLREKFAKKPAVAEANIKVIQAGYDYGHNTHSSATNVYRVETKHKVPGRYMDITGNKATAYGFIAAAEKAGLKLYLGSYPITPATDIMHELAARKDMGGMVVQAEDEIAGVCTAIGAAFAGDLAATSTSGPGLSLKSEAIGLAVMAELPLVVIDVQRGGPSTGLPTKTEQTDLMQAIYGRNGECPAVVIAASSSANCFDYAYQAAKIALENMTPVVLLTDTYLANGTGLWRIPQLKDLPAIQPQSVPEEFKGKYNPALRDERGVRYWAYPGMEGYEHRNIGLERDAQKGTISTNPENHQQMVITRQAKINQIADQIPLLQVQGNANSDTLLIGWGSTEGHLHAAANQLGCALAHFNYINPLPKNTEEVLRQYKHLIVCELNNGQFASYLRSKFEGIHLLQYNELTAQPFAVDRIVNFVKNAF